MTLKNHINSLINRCSFLQERIRSLGSKFSLFSIDPFSEFEGLRVQKSKQGVTKVVPFEKW